MWYSNRRKKSKEEGAQMYACDSEPRKEEKRERENDKLIVIGCAGEL